MSLLINRLVLLAFRPTSNKFVGSYLTYAIPGAILIELTKEERIIIGEKSKVNLLSETPLSDDRLSEALKMVTEAKKPRPASQWVMRFASKIKNLRHRSVAPFVESGAVKVEEKSFLGIFRWKVYDLIDPSERDRLSMEILAVLREEKKPEGELIPVIQVAHAVGMLRQYLPKEERKAMMAALKEIGRDEATGKAVDAAVAAATFAATSAATTVAASSGSS